MRILVVEAGLADDGALRVTLDRAARWAGLGASVRVVVLSHDDSGVPVTVPAGVDLVHVTPGPARLRRRAPAAVRVLLREARRADVVVAGREVGDGLLGAALVARLTRTPLAVTVQSSARRAVEQYVPPRLRALTWRLLRGADLLVPVSAVLAEELLREGVDPARVRTVTNGVDVTALREAAAAEPDPALPAGRLVVAAGRLTRQKGLDLLVAAHARALSAGAPPHSLLVLGEGEERAALETQAADLGVAASVHLVGFRRDAPAVLARADVFALPSRWEGYVLALVEALALGVPVVAADCPSGPTEILRGGQDGRLVPPEDVDALAAALGDALAEPDDLRRRASAAAADAQERFSASGAAAAHLALLRPLVRS